MQREEAESYLHKKVEDGELISPVLPEGIKNYLVDIDGTICDDIPNEEPERMATAKSVWVSSKILAKALVIFFARSSKLPAQPTQKTTVAFFPSAASSANVGMFSFIDYF